MEAQGGKAKVSRHRATLLSPLPPHTLTASLLLLQKTDAGEDVEAPEPPKPEKKKTRKGKKGGVGPEEEEEVEEGEKNGEQKEQSKASKRPRAVVMVLIHRN